MCVCLSLFVCIVGKHGCNGRGLSRFHTPTATKDFFSTRAMQLKGLKMDLMGTFSRREKNVSKLLIVALPAVIGVGVIFPSKQF